MSGYCDDCGNTMCICDVPFNEDTVGLPESSLAPTEGRVGDWSPVLAAAIARAERAERGLALARASNDDSRKLIDERAAFMLADEERRMLNDHATGLVTRAERAEGERDEARDLVSETRIALAAMECPPWTTSEMGCTGELATACDACGEDVTSDDDGEHTWDACARGLREQRDHFLGLAMEIGESRDTAARRASGAWKRLAKRYRWLTPADLASSNGYGSGLTEAAEQAEHLVKGHGASAGEVASALRHFADQWTDGKPVNVVAGLRAQLADALKERDEARAVVEVVKRWGEARKAERAALLTRQGRWGDVPLCEAYFAAREVTAARFGELEAVADGRM